MIEPYQAVVLQGNIVEPPNPAAFRQVVRDNIWRQLVLLRRFKFSYGRVRLVALPELCTHGLDATGDRARMRSMALPLPIDRPLWEVPGAEEMAMYAMAANEFDIYLSGSTWEVDEHWPDLTFHTGFVLSPEGKVVLKQRMVNCGLGQSGTSGMYSRLSEAYGDDSGFGPFPVIDTPIGRLGLCVGGDLIALEPTRILALKGAEVILHPMGERNMETSRHIAAMKRVSAFVNQCYVISANIGQYGHQRAGSPAPPNDELAAELRNALCWGEFEFMGRSQIIAPDGQLLAFIPAAGESAAGAVIDVERLRHDRLATGFAFRAEAYAREYEAFGGAPTDWEGSGLSRNQRVRATAARLIEQDILRRSEGYGGELGGGQFSELPAVARPDGLSR